jgi:hypothetical protein
MTELSESIKFVRLSSGEDLVTEFSEYEDNEVNYYTLHNPMKILYTTNMSGYMSITLMQWVFNRICDKQVFEINPSEVQIIADPSDSMKKYYMESVDHYINKKSKSEQETTVSEDDPFDEPTTEEEALEIIRNMLDTTANKKDKRKLH